MAEDVDRHLEKDCKKDETKKMELKEDQIKDEKEKNILEDDPKAHIKEVIQPVMEEYDDELKSRGHHYRIQEEEYERDFLIDERYKESYLIRKLYARAQSDLYRYPNYIPHFRFILEPFRKDVRSGGRTGPVEYYELEKITKNLVSNRLVKWIKKVFLKA